MDIASEWDGESWRCDLTVDRKYQVRALRLLLEHQDQVYTGKFRWIKQVPMKVMCFIWRAKMCHIPSVVALSNRGITLPSKLCCQFEKLGEIDDHALVSCPFAKTMLEWIFKCCVHLLKHIWKARNERLFNDKKVCATKLVDTVISMFLWFKHRSMIGCISRTD
uniref:Reverse transcriptase zinc-binding domain-containing protein n=1 Tax=Lactuca sativa TaxID=4236 RepID=A0A9R1WF63_LACSA|nr:hypothetical protein LSAT_V11C200087470 [Lactuca sativa]